MNQQYFSEEGLKKLREEFENRVSAQRPEIATRIREAKELGDLSENAEYAEAKEAQALNEGRIEEIKNILENAVLISEGKSSGVITVGSSIKVESKGSGVREYAIVGAAESNPLEGFISNESPLGAAFLGHKRGDLVKVTTPKGVTEFKIVEVK